MKKILAAAVIVTAMTLPAFAEGEDSSTKAGEGKGTVKSTTEMKKNTPATTGEGVIVRPSTTGSSSTNQLNKEENSSPANPGQKTGISGGNDSGGGSSSGGDSGGSGGSSGNR